MAWSPVHGRSGCVARQHPLTRKKDANSLIRTRATRLSADLATCIGFPRVGLTVVVVLLRKCLLQFVVVLLAKRTLAFAVEVQEVAEILLEIPDGVHRDVDSKVRGVGIGYRDFEDQLAAAV